MLLNTVIGGAYKSSLLHMSITGKVYISYHPKGGKVEKIPLNNETVQSFIIVDQNIKTMFGSGAMRGMLGGAVFGIAGALAGANSAKQKKEYIIELNFTDGQHSIIEVDKNMFDVLMRTL